MASFHRHTADADVAVVEGVMGLFDGRDGHTDQGSTAQVAKWLGAPVVLVLDCSAIARSAAAVVKGYQDFDPRLRLGGLIFNKVGGDAHTQWLADAITSAGLNVPVLGGIPKVGASRRRGRGRRAGCSSAAGTQCDHTSGLARHRLPYVRRLVCFTGGRVSVWFS